MLNESITEGDEAREMQDVAAASSASRSEEFAQDASSYSSQQNFLNLTQSSCENNTSSQDRAWKRITSVSMMADENWESNEFIFPSKGMTPLVS